MPWELPSPTFILRAPRDFIVFVLDCCERWEYESRERQIGDLVLRALKGASRHYGRYGRKGSPDRPSGGEGLSDANTWPPTTS